MSQSQSIARHLPYLRRFARALTGNQASGDAYSIATLEAISSDKSFPPDQWGTKQHFFHVFLKIWSSMVINHKSTEFPENVGVSASWQTIPELEAADRSLDRLTPLPRVVFLLHALEDFKTVDIAAMLAVSTGEIEALLVQAGAEITAQLSTDVLIIEDEPVIAMDLEALVNDLGHSVIAIARTRTEAVAAIKNHDPGLVLADIQLADGSSGLDAVNDILRECTVPVVFITAYPERLLTGERPEPTFLISKPFRPETVMAVINQALFFDRRAALVGR